jgi:hypothetical protein
MNRYPMTALFTYVLVLIGGLVVLGGAIYAINIEGRGMGGTKFAVFGGFAASGVLLWLLAGLSQALLNTCEDVQAELAAKATDRETAREAAYKASRNRS